MLTTTTLALALAACTATDPGARSGHTMAFDRTLGEVVLFGGLEPTGTTPFPRTLWAWNGNGWRCLSDGSDGGPAGRIDAHLAFDAARGRLVLFGGRQLTRDRQSIFLRDTWEWDGRAWARADTAGPGPRVHGAMEYDPVRKALVLHGGGGAQEMLHDSWEWSGNSWRALGLATPSNSLGNSLTVTSAGLVLLGAVRDSSPGCTGRRRATLFAVRGDSLAPLNGEGPCFSPQAPVAATGEGLILFAGWNSPAEDEPAESWLWSGARWSQVAQPPAKRRGASMAFDARRGRAVLYGGEGTRGLLADVWEFDGTRWTNVKH